MTKIKKIRFISFITTLLTYLVINTNNIYASTETYINASDVTRLISAFMLLSALFSVVVFISTSVYILVKE